MMKSGRCKRLSGMATDEALILALRLTATAGETVLDAMDVAATREVSAFLLASTAPSQVLSPRCSCCAVSAAADCATAAGSCCPGPLSELSGSAWVSTGSATASWLASSAPSQVSFPSGLCSAVLATARRASVVGSLAVCAGVPSSTPLVWLPLGALSESVASTEAGGVGGLPLFSLLIWLCPAISVAGRQPRTCCWHGRVSCSGGRRTRHCPRTCRPLSRRLGACVVRHRAYTLQVHLQVHSLAEILFLHLQRGSACRSQERGVLAQGSTECLGRFLG